MSKLNTPTSNYESGSYQESQLSLSLRTEDIVVPGSILADTLHDHTYGGSFVIGDRAFAVGGGMLGMFTGSTTNTKNEEYDPVLNAWSLRAPMLSARRYCCTFVKDGKGYVARGYSDVAIDSWGYEVNMTIDSYSPSTNTWTTEYTSCIDVNGRAAGIRGYNDHTPDAVVVDGIIYIIGGDHGTRIEVIENNVPRLLKNEWNNEVQLYLSSPVCAFVKNKSIYISSIESKLVKFDTILKTFTDMPGPSVPRKYGSVEFFKNKYYHIGGIDQYGYGINVCEAYDVDNNIWSSEEVMNFAGYGGVSFVVKDKLYSFSRIIPDGTGRASRNEVLESTGTWKNIIEDIIKKPEIRYTLDGSEPSNTSLLFSNTLQVNLPATIKAKAIYTGYTDSDILYLNFKLAYDMTSEFSISALFNGKMSNVLAYTKYDIDHKPEYNILSEKYMKDISKNIMLSDDDMVLDLEIFNSINEAGLDDISTDLHSDEYYVFVFDKSELNIDVSRSPNINIHSVGDNIVGYNNIFLPHPVNRLILRFNSGHNSDSLLNILKIKLHDLNLKSYTFRKFGIFKASDFEKHMIKDPDIVNHIIKYDPKLNSNIKSEVVAALNSLIEDLNKSIRLYNNIYMPECSTMYIKVNIILQVSKNISKGSMLKIECEYYNDRIYSDLDFKETILLKEYDPCESLGFFKLIIEDGISLKEIFDKINEHQSSMNVFMEYETPSDLYGEYDAYYLVLESSLKHNISDLNKLSIPPKTKTTSASMKTTILSSDIFGIDNNKLYFTGGNGIYRNTPEPIKVEYKPIINIESDNEANTLYRNNPLNTIISNTAQIKAYAPRSSITDSFLCHKEFYYEDIDKTFIENINENHEWFRLYGINLEESIKNVYVFKRRSKNSIIIIDGVPLEFSDFNMVTYNDQEYIPVKTKEDIVTLGELHTFNHSMNPRDSALFIHKDGTINSDSVNGLCIGDYDEFMTFEKGVHYIPDGYVAHGSNYIVTTLNDKLKKYTKRVVIHNKIVIVEDEDTKVRIPIKESSSMYESALKLMYTKLGSDIQEWLSIINTMTNDTSFTTSELLKTKFVPDIKTVKTLHNPNGETLSDIDIFLKEYTAEQRAFTFEEKDLNILVSEDTLKFGRIHTPKILLPVPDTECNILVFVNDKLLSTNPERIDDNYISLDISTVYNIKDFSATPFEEILQWYGLNKKNNIFEVKLYDKEDIILETVFTRDNDNFVPIPIDLLDRKYFEVYIDGLLANLDEIFAATNTYTNENTIYSSVGKVESTVLGLLLNTLNDNRPNIPVLFIRKSISPVEYSIGSKVTVICRKSTNTTKRYPIVSNMVFVPEGIYHDTGLYYTNGSKLTKDDYLQLSSHLVFIKRKMDNNNILVKTRSEYELNKMNREYSRMLFDLMSSFLEKYEALESESEYRLYEMSSDEFSAYCYMVSLSMYIMKDGKSNGEMLSISGTMNGLTLSINDILVKKILPSVGYSIVKGKISPYVYMEPKTIESYKLSNKYFYRKVSYIISLYFAEYLTQYKVNKFDMSLFNDPTIPHNLEVSITTSDLIAYNTLFGKVVPIPFISNLDFTGSVNDIFDAYSVIDRIPVSYGVLPEKVFSGSGFKPVNPEDKRITTMRVSNPDYSMNISSKVSGTIGS